MADDKKIKEEKPEPKGEGKPTNNADGELKEVASAAAEATGEEPNALLGVLKKISDSPAGDAIIDLVMKGAESSGEGGAPKGMPIPKPGGGGMPMPSGGGMPMPGGGGAPAPGGGGGAPDMSKLLASMGGAKGGAPAPAPGGGGGGMPAPKGMPMPGGGGAPAPMPRPGGGEEEGKQMPPNLAKLMGGLK